MAEPTTVAFLFVDLVRSTELLHQLGADANATVNEGLFRTLRTSVERATRVSRSGHWVTAWRLPSREPRPLPLVRHRHPTRSSELRIAHRARPASSCESGVSVGEATHLEDGNWSGPAIVEAARLVDQAEAGNDPRQRSRAASRRTAHELRLRPHGASGAQGLPARTAVLRGALAARPRVGRVPVQGFAPVWRVRRRSLLWPGQGDQRRSRSAEPIAIRRRRRGVGQRKELARSGRCRPRTPTWGPCRQRTVARHDRPARWEHLGRTPGDHHRVQPTPTPTRRVVVAIDQFEELYTNYDDAVSASTVRRPSLCRRSPPTNN